MLAVGSSLAVPQTPPRASPKAVVPPQAPMRRVGFAEPRSREPSPLSGVAPCALPQYKGRFCIIPQGTRASLREGAMAAAAAGE